MNRECGVRFTDIFADFNETHKLVMDGDPSAQVKLADMFCPHALGEFRYRQSYSYKTAEYLIAKPDVRKASYWYETAKSKGYYEAYEKLAECYFYGRCGYKQDIGRAVEYYEQASALGGVWSALRLGELYSQGYMVPKDTKRAFGYFLEASKLGDADAFKVLGDCYLHGRGTRRDLAKAKDCYLRALEIAKFNRNKLLYRLGMCCLFGREFEKAVDYFEQSAEYERSEFMLGVCAFAGLGAPKNHHKAFESFYNVAFGVGKRYDLRANVAIAYMLREGIGTEKDTERAKSYLKEAVRGGFAPAKCALDKYYG